MTTPTAATLRSLASVATDAVHLVLTPTEARVLADQLEASALRYVNAEVFSITGSRALQDACLKPELRETWDRLCALIDYTSDAIDAHCSASATGATTQGRG